MKEAREMATIMEESFGECLIKTNLSFVIVPGTNIIKASPYFVLIGTENRAYTSAFILWKLIREATALKWFRFRTASQIENMVFDGVIAYLVETFVGELRTNSIEDWASAVLSDQLRNSLPHEVDERISNKERKIEMNGHNDMKFEVSLTGQVIEIITNMIGENGMCRAIYNFLADVRQKREASLLKSLDQVFLQRNVKDWCGGPFNVTEFFIQWVQKKLPKPGLRFTKFLLHVVVDDRNTIPTVLRVNGSEGKQDYPPTPIFVKSLTDGEESRIWQSQECGIFFSTEEYYVMSLISNNDVILYVGSPAVHRLIYEERGPLSYSTLLSNVYSDQITLTPKEQLVFAADRLHVLLSRGPDYEEIIRLLNVFFNKNMEMEMFMLFSPTINRLYKMMAGTYNDKIFIEYATGLLQPQHWLLWWRDCGDPKKNLHRRMLFPLSVRWDFVMARWRAMIFFDEIVSKGNFLNPNNHRLVHLAESVFCAAVIHNVSYFYLFHDRLIKGADDASDSDDLYEEIIRSLGCTDNEEAITRYTNEIVVHIISVHSC
ncbi:hypothetical protein AB6A40_008292 [Gnathostoma spinigerum]|uniref:Uncharacterized protein n=1 Tax=Gnathostoma spinigerum TaxID=75299 RepID=A0ABD6EWY9_9BILA